MRVFKLSSKRAYAGIIIRERRGGAVTRLRDGLGAAASVGHRAAHRLAFQLRPPRGVELVADEVELLNASAPLPLMMSDEDGEEIRIKYRYLDLRRPRMQRNLRTRARMYRAIRDRRDRQARQDGGR